MTTPADPQLEPLFSSTSILPEEAFQLGKKYQLGKPQEQYKAEFATFAGCLVLVALVMIGPVILTGGLGSSQGIAAVVIVLLVFSFAMLVAFSQRTWRVYVYPDGFIYLKGKVAQAFRWDEIELVKQFRYRQAGTHVNTDIWLIRSKSGKVLQFSHELSRIDALMRTIQAHVKKAE